MTVFYVFMIFFGMTWADTVIGGAVVKESRKDPDRGAEDLRYFEWITWAVGGIIPLLLGPGLLNGIFGLKITAAFLVISLNALLMMFVAWFLPEKNSARRLNVSPDQSYITRAQKE